jgi:hypothetical protein
MSNILLESDFLISDITKFFNKQPTDDSGAKSGGKGGSGTVGTDGTTTGKQKKASGIDWEKEYDRRHAENSKLSSGARKDRSEIDRQFWRDYYTAGWEQPCVDPLMSIGDILWEQIKSYGFTAKKNPLVKFLKLGYVKKALLIPQLLNSDSFESIITAFETDLLKDSEFTQANDYNIIYCRDLYSDDIDMLAYLKAQKAYLSPSASGEYSADQKSNNIRIFLQLSKNKETSTAAAVKKQLSVEYKRLPSMQATGVKLNDLTMVRSILKELSDNYDKYTTGSGLEGTARGKTGAGGRGSYFGGDDREGRSGSAELRGLAKEELADLVARIDTAETRFALMQYLLMHTDIVGASKILKTCSTGITDLKALIPATDYVAKLTKGKKFSVADVALIWGHLEKKRYKKSSSASTAVKKPTDASATAAATTAPAPVDSTAPADDTKKT